MMKLRLSPSLILLLLVGVTLHADSPIKVNPANNHCYQRIDAPLSWHAARDQCIALQGHLVTIADATENEFVFLEFVNPGYWPWLGGSDETIEGIWAWVSGEPWNFSPWYPGEPNNLNGTEHYLTYFNTATREWNDVPNMTLPYVCEWPDPCAIIFADGFEAGDTSQWSVTVPD